MTASDRPWLELYRPQTPADFVASFRTGLELFRNAVDHFGDRPLVLSVDTPIPAERIDADSDALAAAWQAGGLRAGDRVALYLQNVPQFLVGLVAAWKCGAIAVTCNPMLKERELRHILTDSGATVVLAMTELGETARAAADGTDVRSVLLIGDLPHLLEAHRGRRPSTPAVEPDATAVLVYTSGTTGVPKGAEVTHQGFCYAAQMAPTWFDLTPDDVNLGGAPLFHIAGLVVGLGSSLFVPMPLVLAGRFDAAETLRLVERHRVTFVLMAITAFTALLNEPTFAHRDLTSLTKVASGGAPVPPAIVDQWERATGRYIHNGYGLTESTAGTHLVPFGARGPVDPATGVLSVGIPLPCTRARVVDAAGRELPPGEVGEILLRGPQLTRGYWRNPEESRSAFSDGWLRTGDVGFMDPAGWLYLVDRRKDMIVASGYKVWPREVENVLYEHPAVREGAVVGIPDAYRGETVKAFVSLKPGASVTADELIGFARERLAAYKVPRSIEVLDDLPKTSSGKILRRELRDPAHVVNTEGNEER